jgi:hypothetical protein
VTYNPIQQELTALSNMLKGLSSTELTTAKRSAAQNDLILASAQDDKFPTTKTGVKAGNLTSAQQELVLALSKPIQMIWMIKAAAAIYAKYKADIADTYISYYGTTDLTSKGDYVLIDARMYGLSFRCKAV